MLSNMKHHLSFLLLASLGLLGCGNFVTHAELDTTTNALRADVANSANGAALAVHQCAMTRAFAERAAQECMLNRLYEGLQGTAQSENSNAERSLVCLLTNTWQEYCLSTEDDRLVNPRPGVEDAIEQLISHSREQRRSGHSHDAQDSSEETSVQEEFNLFN